MFKLLDDENLRKQFILESVSPMTLADDILSEIQEIMKHFLEYWTMFPIVNNHQKLFFEEEFQLPRLRMKGRIDFSCYDVKNESLLLLDFKKSTVPTYSEIEKYEQWQVLCYLAGWKSLHPEFNVKKIILGYLNLSSMKESPLVVNFNVEDNAFLAGMSFREIKNFDLWVKEFEDHWIGYVNDLTKEEKFLPFPRHVSVCEYCAVKNSCPKGVQE